MKNDLAIVIPYYKIDFFKETLLSIEDQTDKNFNLYIGNDASPEDPISLIEDVLQETKYVYHRFEANMGGISLSKQWERCMALTDHEEWIMILGDDDVLSPNVVEEFYTNLPLLEAYAIGVVRCSSRTIDEYSRIIKQFPADKQIFESKVSYINKLEGKGRSSLSEHIFSRKAYLKNNFKDFPVAYGADDVAWLEFSDFGKILALPSAFVNVRNSGINISSIKNKDIAHKRVLAIHQYNRYILWKYGHLFSRTDRIKIAAKSYHRLQHSKKGFNFWLLKFIFTSIKRLGIVDTIRVMINNKRYKY